MTALNLAACLTRTGAGPGGIWLGWGGANYLGPREVKKVF